MNQDQTHEELARRAWQAGHDHARRQAELKQRPTPMSPRQLHQILNPTRNQGAPR